LDVHKDSVTACVLVFDEHGQRHVRKKEFRTYWSGLQKLKMCLYASKVMRVAMKCTGVYWKPVWNVLEGRFPLLPANPDSCGTVGAIDVLICAQAARPRRRRALRPCRCSTPVAPVADGVSHEEHSRPQDGSERCRMIADLLAHGLLRATFVPPRAIQELRDWTRYRVKLVGEYNRIQDRIHKMLEDANLTLSSVASDILGASGRAISAGDVNPTVLSPPVGRSFRNGPPSMSSPLPRARRAHRAAWPRALGASGTC
jgi:hypothetical protein